MFQIGERVVYGVHGVCEIKDVEQQKQDQKMVSYLVLEPMIQAGARYLVPMHNAAAMAKLHKMCTVEELEQLLHSEKVRSQSWIADEGQRKQLYRQVIASADRIKLMQLVHMLYVHKSGQLAAGRKVHLCDENFLLDAEKLLVSELSVVMQQEAEQAKRYLRSCLSE